MDCGVAVEVDASTVNLRADPRGSPAGTVNSTAIAGHDPRQADDAAAALTFAEAAEVVFTMREPTWCSPNSGPTGEP